MKQLDNRKDSLGFTIVELLIVIIVIGILATLVLIAYNNVQTQARDTKRQADANSIRDAVSAYDTASTSGYYPSQGSSFATDVATVSTINLDPVLASKISTNAPTASTKDSVASAGANGAYYYSYCGTTKTASAATGFQVVYWSEKNSGLVYVYGGNGSASNC